MSKKVATKQMKHRQNLPYSIKQEMILNGQIPEEKVRMVDLCRLIIKAQAREDGEALDFLLAMKAAKEQNSTDQAKAEREPELTLQEAMDILDRLSTRKIKWPKELFEDAGLTLDPADLAERDYSEEA